ncbi:arylesterase [Sphingomonas sp. RS2018]
MRIILALMLLSACSPQAPAPGPSPTPRAAPAKLVVAFGDSLYAGYGVLPQQAFPYRLEQALKARGLSVEVRNAGVSGETTAGGRARLASALGGLGRTPDLVLVGLGGNDMLLGIDPATTRANLDSICAELTRRGILIVLTGMVAAPQRGAEYAQAFDPIWRDLARRYDAGLDPFFLAGLVGNRRLMLADGLHPAPAGIERITARVAPLVAARLE